MPIKINGTNTAANPSITGTDTDTGIVYGSDQIDFSIGGSSKVFLNSSGNQLFTGNAVIGVNSNSSNLYLGGGSNQPSEAYLESGTFSAFKVNGSERMRLDSSGRVGIGDSSPTKPLTVGTTTPSILLDDQSGRLVELIGGSSSTGPELRTAYAEDLRFGTNSTERMRINTSGNLGIGATAPNAPIHIQKSGVNLILQNWHVDLPSANNRTLILYGPETDSTGDPFRFITGNSIQFKVDANVVFHALDNGRIHLPTVQANTTSAGANVNISSDFVRRVTSSIRYKKDITTATWGLAKVLQLKPVTFKNNASGDQADDKTYAGFTAEDVHELGLSEFVEYNQSNEPEGIYYANMVSLLTKAIQELNTKVETLETEKTKLQTDLTALTARVAALEAA